MTWPTTNEPRDNFVTVRLSDNEVAEVDRYQRKHGLRSRSAAVRSAVAEAVMQPPSGATTTQAEGRAPRSASKKAKS